MGFIKRLYRLFVNVVSIFSGVSVAVAFAPLIFLIPPLRYFLYRVTLTGVWWTGKYELIAKTGIFCFYSYLAVGLPLIAIRVLGSEHLFDGIVAAGLFIAFFAFQYPRMFPPNFAVTFTTVSMDEKSYRKTVKGGGIEQIFFSITNLGIVHLKHGGSHFDFEEGFQVRASNKTSTTGDAKRMQFKPGVFDLTLPPFLSQQMLVLVKTPNKEGTYLIRCTLYSESTWGAARHTLKLQVSND